MFGSSIGVFKVAPVVLERDQERTAEAVCRASDCPPPSCEVSGVASCDGLNARHEDLDLIDAEFGVDGVGWSGSSHDEGSFG